MENPKDYSSEEIKYQNNPDVFVERNESDSSDSYFRSDSMHSDQFTKSKNLFEKEKICINACNEIDSDFE